MNDATAKFLECCRVVGIKRVAIYRRTGRIPGSLSFPWEVGGSVFAREVYDRWPAIWEAAKASGLHYGGGNADQAFVERGVLTPGVYALKAGQWTKESEGIE